MLVANTVANFLVFAPVQILTKGGPQGSTNLIMNEIYTRAFIGSDPGSASAATVVLVTLVLVIVFIQFRMMRGGRPMTSPAYFRAIRMMAIIFCGLLFLLPLWWVTISALRPEADIFSYISPHRPVDDSAASLHAREHDRALADASLRAPSGTRCSSPH